MRIDWNEKALLRKVDKICLDAAEWAADRVEADAKRILMQAAKEPTGRLAREIDVKKSRFKDFPGYIVQAQGPGNYSRFYATFVELGHYSSEWGRHKRGSKTGAYVPPIPFLRRALVKNKQGIYRKYKNLNKRL